MNRLAQWYVDLPWSAAALLGVAFMFLVFMVLAVWHWWRDPLNRERRAIRRRRVKLRGWESARCSPKISRAFMRAFRGE
jgi:hypothetical protein